MSGTEALAWTDSHCHLHDLDDVQVLLERARSAHVTRLVCVGTTISSSVAALLLARAASLSALTDNEQPKLFATIGQHPHDASNDLSEITQLLGSSDQLIAGANKPAGSVVGVGECGLDYHYDYSPRERQREAFIAQIGLARTHDLTLVVHTREAWEDTFAILGEERLPQHVIIHCFTGGPTEARRCLDLGTYLSFSGIATFKNAEDVREAARLCPTDRLLIETDAPYLAPVPHRGSPNEPAYVALVGEALASLRGVDVHDFAVQTSENATKAFELAQ
jgi:TatD DNase family protein